MDEDTRNFVLAVKSYSSVLTPRNVTVPKSPSIAVSLGKFSGVPVSHLAPLSFQYMVKFQSTYQDLVQSSRQILVQV